MEVSETTGEKSLTNKSILLQKILNKIMIILVINNSYLKQLQIENSGSKQTLLMRMSW